VKKTIAILLACLCLANIAACKSQSAFSAIYRLTSAKPQEFTFTTLRYQEGGITIEYPQLENYSDAKVQKKINSRLEKDATAILDNYGKTSNVEVKYEVRLANDNMISVSYVGDAYAAGWAHPVNIAYTSNVSSSAASHLKLSDFYKIDKGFVESILYESYPEDKAAAIAYLKNQDISDLVSLFKGADKDESSEVFSSFGQQALTLYIEVPHAIGDYTTLDVPYSALYPYERL